MYTKINYFIKSFISWISDLISSYQFTYVVLLFEIKLKMKEVRDKVRHKKQKPSWKKEKKKR